MINIILCGGNGTRLWPISRTLMPKQFVKLFSDKSLFQLTVERNSKLCKSRFIVSNSEQYFLALDQLEELNKDNNKYLLESIGRNTAPAIALACMELNYDEIVLVTPSDHLIKDEKEYEKVINKAKEFANDNKLVTFGINPTFPETGFGYIESENTYDVKAFHEKPDLQSAIKYLEAGNYYWNSGMFCFKVGIFLDELNKYSPAIYESSKIAFENKQFISNNQIRIKYEDMEAIPEDSIDYAVMEKSDIVKVIPSNISWSDLGSFDSLYEELEKDENFNTVNPNHISIDSKNNLVYGNERQIATVDVEDLIVIDTGDALLISKKGSSQKVKKVVEKLKEVNSQLHNIHLTGHRPWGTYTILEESNGYKIKRIEVNPGKRLSLQKHFHRSEHWIVVSGTATVTVGDEKRLVRPNESTYIKAGELHRLENEGKIPVVLIEAQVGEYTGEDDIVRIEDDFSRECKN
ncbi:mannose-1-phosphate guanylyltransferase/mannose-6-phosphate isomerase [Aliarcobacter butzleri]|uniref:mannose-1-phosphate guanylyltransferase/mannose-6-phosphate isomerase n=1 Tax=Aliarcobacter butzleri TaxID=28197 RepID=UPI00263DEDCC|nr:mannose-1-phosphate guanylyltransferase/mannose-6-phosphate isomerase [Aliarcobacter butzleri]MDN5042674.1 mannose-1-phosphate guanylyltransferase/mannose-6-phosphate isomerase [Aliarcobacter butzleri]